MMMMLRASAVKNIGSRWALAMMSLIVKMTNLRQFPPLPVDPHSFSSLFISYKMVTRVFVRGFDVRTLMIGIGLLIFEILFIKAVV